MNHDTDSSGDVETTRASHTPVPDIVTGVEHPAVTIVEAVAAATGRLATDLPPLQHTVDSDALEVLLRSESASPITITFTYADTTVSVTRSESMEIQVVDARRDDE